MKTSTLSRPSKQKANCFKKLFLKPQPLNVRSREIQVKWEWKTEHFIKLSLPLLLHFDPPLLGLRETPQKMGTCTQEAPQFKARPRTGVSINVENKVLNLSVNLTPKIVDWPMKNPGHSHRIWWCCARYILEGGGSQSKCLWNSWNNNHFLFF